MNDAIGVGLAATQVGIPHRVLVYRVGRSPVDALVNPVLEWSGGEETAEEGCLSLPDVQVEVERPVHVRVDAQNEQGERSRRGVGPRGAGHPARDGPPRRRPDPRPHHARAAQGSERRARGLAAAADAAGRRELSTLGRRSSRRSCEAGRHRPPSELS